MLSEKHFLEDRTKFHTISLVVEIKGSAQLIPTSATAQDWVPVLFYFFSFFGVGGGGTEGYGLLQN
jgi:hypothetical protein